MEEAKEMKPFNNERVLIVDDNVVNIIITTSLLHAWNLQVDIASNGLEAIRKVLVDHYNLVLMDIDMPVLNGGDAAKHIRRLGNQFDQLPIVAFSALDTGIIDSHVAGSAMNGYIKKPFDRTQLYETVRDHLVKASSPQN
jgi:CheY-like chemotaxis protein